MATEAWAANPAAMSTSSAVNAGRPVRLAAVSTPSVPCDPVSGTIIIGPTSSSPVLAGDVPSSSWGVATRSGSPVVNTRPDSEPAIGTRRMSATAGAPFPTAISTHRSGLPWRGSTTVTRSAAARSADSSAISCNGRE